jgi:hypothetical protein
VAGQKAGANCPTGTIGKIRHINRSCGVSTRCTVSFFRSLVNDSWSAMVTKCSRQSRHTRRVQTSKSDLNEFARHLLLTADPVFLDSVKATLCRSPLPSSHMEVEHPLQSAYDGIFESESKSSADAIAQYTALVLSPGTAAFS